MIDTRLFEQEWPEGEYRFMQLGFVVEDLVESAFKWSEVHGVGPFHVLPRSKAACTYRGTPSHMDLQVAAAQAGPVQIELIQQFDDTPSVLREGLGEGRSVFHQLCTVTKDYDGKKAHYEKLGYPVACEITGPMRVAYVDTVRDFGYFTEIVEYSDGFIKQLKRVSDTCRDWNGKDPVRILTREGYRTP